MSLLAIDAGSSSCKAVVFSEDGRVLAEKACSYGPFESPHPTWAEMPVENFWQAFLESAQYVCGQVRHDPVEAIAISSHGETFVAVDRDSKPIAAAILNFDNRATAEAIAIRERLGQDLIFDITGLTSHPMYPVPKLLWMASHIPDGLSTVARILTVPGYILTRLGLPGYVDYSLASRFLAFDVRRHEWSGEILSKCGICRDVLPHAVPAGTVAGDLSSITAREIGVHKGVPVVVGGHDQPCAALGSGVFDSERVSASLGTYECVVAASREPALSKHALLANLNSYCHVVPERYVTLAYFASGIMLEWFLRVFCSTEKGRASSREVFASLEASACGLQSGLLVAPHLLGTCNPDFNPAASGVIVGIRPGTRRADIYKGILEGIACEFASMCDLLQTATGPLRGIYVSGGGARSELGLKLRAALSGRELHVMQCDEAVCLGTAILAGVAIGKYRDIPEAVEHLVGVSRSIAPDPQLAFTYSAQKEQYRILYASMASLRDMQKLRPGDNA